jgi:hypothetical protein
VARPSTVALFASAALAACGGPGPDEPSAVIDLVPETICLGDDHATEVLMDGRASSAHLALIPVAPAPGDPPLVFSWELSGAEARIVSGGLDRDRLVVTTAGDRPLHVTLAVTNAAGGVAEHLRTLSITLPERTACTSSSACGAGQVCASDLGVCIVDHDCASDDDCEPCTICELPGGRCVPRSR